MKKILSITITSLLFVSTANSQQWNTNGLNGPGNGNSFGTSFNSPINIYTNGQQRAYFSTNQSLNSFTGDSGDGLQIINPNVLGSGGDLSLFTSQNNGGNETHAVFGLNGQVSGQNNRFEIRARARGFLFNTELGIGVYRFARSGTVTASVGTNNFWRIGPQAVGPNVINANRRLEVVDNNWQFRLTHRSSNSWSDFRTLATGNLLIRPQNGRVGINLTTNPTANLDVNGNARLRNVQQINQPDALFVGRAVGGNNDDLRVRRLEFTGDVNDVLLGDGTWGSAASVPSSNNGVWTNANNELQLGVPCNTPTGGINFGPLYANQLTEDRGIFLNDKTFWFLTGQGDYGGVGFGAQLASTPFCGTGNTVEISANLNNTKYGGVDASGLRFTKLLSSSPTIDNGVNGVDGTKVLTVDGDGDVVLTDAVSSSFVLCDDNSGSTDLTGDSKLNLNNNNLYFEGDSDGNTNKMALGYVCGDGLTGKFNVYSDQDKWNSYFLTDGTAPLDPNEVGGVYSLVTNSEGANSYGIIGEVTEAPSGNLMADRIGVYGKVSSTLAKRPIGVLGESYALSPTSNAIGGWFKSVGSNSGKALFVENSGVLNGSYSYGADIRSNGNGASTVYGVNARGTGENANVIGGNFIATGNNSPNYGVRGTASGSNTTNYGVYGSAAGGTVDYAGYFVGDVYVNGNLVLTSDENLKENIEEIENATEIINQLNPVSFDFKQSGQYEHLNLAEEHQYGMIAQEVEQILPDVIHDGIAPAQYDSLGNEIHAEMEFKTMNYEALIPILTKGIQEQNQVIESMDSTISVKDSLINDLNDRLSNLENCLSNILPMLCNMNQSVVQPTTDDVQEQLENTMNIELSNRDNIVLNQNVPNPFAENTTISYSVPSSVQNARIVFYNNQGIMIKEVEISERGNGRINVYGSDLSKGMYSYTLIADGKIIATKKMVKQ